MIEPSFGVIVMPVQAVADAIRDEVQIIAVTSAKMRFTDFMAISPRTHWKAAQVYFMLSQRVSASESTPTADEKISHASGIYGNGKGYRR